MRKTIWTIVCNILCAGLMGCAPLPFGGTPNRNSANPPMARESNGTTTSTQSNQSGNSSSDKAKNTTGNSGVDATNTPKPSPATPAVPVLKIGSTGADVYQLNELLAKTGYLPLTYTGSADKGVFAWTYKVTPKALVALWKDSSFTLLTKSAVMTMESVNGLAVDGVAGPQVWSTLIKDVATGAKNPYGFTFVQVSLHTPQSLVLWHSGVTIMTTPVNSGIPQSPTVKGTYPVYLQYRTQTMSGTDVSGHHYSDPGVPYVSYFYEGEAIHGFPRAAYGYPQSLGCVELPISAAKRVWPYIHLGTLVHIS